MGDVRVFFHDFNTYNFAPTGAVAKGRPINPIFERYQGGGQKHHSVTLGKSPFVFGKIQVGPISWTERALPFREPNPTGTEIAGASSSPKPSSQRQRFIYALGAPVFGNYEGHQDAPYWQA